MNPFVKRLAALSIGLVLALGPTGCAGAPAPGTATLTASPRPAEFVYGRTLEVVTEWDPARAYSSEVVALHNIYETLTVWNPVARKVAPRLATSWHSSADGRTWTFTLRRGVRFHTGRLMDAAAVKQAIERTIASKSAPSYIWDAVETIRADNPSTVTFTLKYAAPLDRIASATYAAFVYDPAGVDQAGRRDGGTGPYTIELWRKGAADELTLKAFPGYWGGWDRPHYTKVRFHVSASHREHWRRLLRGETTFVWRFGRSLQARAAATGGLRTTRRPSYATLMMLFNTASGPMADVRVRKAVQHAVDYEGVLRALHENVSPASGIIPEGLPGHQRGRTPRQDLQRAAELLARAGYGPQGRPLRLTLTYAAGDADQRLLAERLAATLSTLNVTLVARAMPWLKQWERGKRRGQDIFVMYWWPDYADAYSYFASMFRSADPPSFNLTYLKDQGVDAVIDSLPRLSVTDPKAAERAYAQLTSTLLDVRAVAAVPWVVTYRRAYAAGVQGYHDNPAYPDVVFVYELRPSA
ncbi:ABC transporter substrate-binding protein [Thermoactinospora rubra]|uniref:ABC transporter substrate-binding protein n=1 Tax=Thermoactinospora rubra TaxID=1088767 RepID=UPI000A10C994|nr:ABC transporter substrate-binding protein [Thermoactinospora rubra]